VCASYVLVVAAASALNFATAHLVDRLRVFIARDLQSAMYQLLLSLSLPFFVSRRTGELASRFQIDAVATADSFDPVMRGVVGSLVQLVLYATILVRTDGLLALAVAVVTLSHVLITRFLQAGIRKRTIRWMDTYGQVGAAVQESILAIRVVKSFSAEGFETRRFAALMERLRTNLVNFSLYASAEQPLRDLANAAVVAVALLLSFAALKEGRLTMPGFVLFVVVVRQATIPFSQLNTAFVTLHKVLGSSQRIRELLDVRPALADGSAETPPLQHGVRFENVSFAYETGPVVLNEISFDLPRGHLVALVGPSGAGKSTLADLLLRLHDPGSGRVTFDARDIRDFRQASYRRRFGVVPQEPLLFNASVGENIAYGRPAVPAEVERAARIANAHDFVSQLPNGYDTLVGERGIRLSGGQRQRVAIARAIYGRPDVLVLDEATSSLDSESERLVQAAIDQVLLGSTALVIAHRLSTVARADAIVVLDKGRVEAIGPHAALLETSPLYRRLYEAQFRDEGPPALPDLPAGAAG
jgi:ABC-type multidrug transport system fused ATPase/permease subunit